MRKIMSLAGIVMVLGLVFVGCTNAINPILRGTVTITGTAVVGQTLTANIGDLDGSGDVTFQWRRGTTAIGTNSPTYQVQSADIGFTITVTVTRAGSSGSVTSAEIGPVTAASLPSLTGTVSISGTTQVGQTLTANIENLGGTGTITYQWRRGTTNIGTNSQTYQVQAADVGHTITVTVTRSGSSGNVTSVAVGPVVSIIREGLTIEFADFHKMAPIQGPTLRLLGTPEEASGTITVASPELYDSIRWFFEGREITGNMVSNNGAVLTLGTRIHGEMLGIGSHEVTVEVRKSGRLYSQRIAFTVAR